MRAILVKEFGDAEVMQVGEVGVPEPARDEILVRIPRDDPLKSLPMNERRNQDHRRPRETG